VIFRPSRNLLTVSFQLCPRILESEVMPLKSDIVIDAAKFQPSAILEQTTKLNQHLVDIFAPAPKWYEVREASYS
jgi:hypothetical protein